MCLVHERKVLGIVLQLDEPIDSYNEVQEERIVDLVEILTVLNYVHAVFNELPNDEIGEDVRDRESKDIENESKPWCL